MSSRGIAAWLGGSRGGLGLLEHSRCCFHTWKLAYQLVASVSDGEQIVSFAALLLCFLCRFANSLLPFRECQIHPRLYLSLALLSFVSLNGIYFSESIQNLTVNALSIPFCFTCVSYCCPVGTELLEYEM